MCERILTEEEEDICIQIEREEEKNKKKLSEINFRLESSQG